MMEGCLNGMAIVSALAARAALPGTPCDSICFVGAWHVCLFDAEQHVGHMHRL